MDNQLSINSVDASTIETKTSLDIPNLSKYRMPCLDSYCFCNIPDTVLEIFGSENRPHPLPKDVLGQYTEKYDNVVVVLVDALGWVGFERYREDLPILRDVEKKGTVSKITSQFPSTTGAHLPTIHSGYPVSQHGIVEGAYYESRYGIMIWPLTNKVARMTNNELNNASKETKIDPKDVYPEGAFYKDLKKLGVTPHIIQNPDFMKCKFNQTMMADTTFIDGDSLSAQLKNMVHIINSKLNPKNYFYIYIPEYDQLGHKNGFASDATDSKAKEIFKTLKSAFDGIQQKTLLVVTADHGLRNYPEKFYLDEEIPELRKHIKRDKQGRLIVIGGNEADRFLYVREPEVVKEGIEKKLDHRAEVVFTSDLVKEGFFGKEDTFSEPFRKNLPDLMIIGTGDTGVVWRGRKEGFDINGCLGIHGGLNPEEMDSLFLALEIGG